MVDLEQMGKRSDNVFHEYENLVYFILMVYDRLETNMSWGRPPKVKVYEVPLRVQVPEGCVLSSEIWKVRAMDTGVSHMIMVPCKLIELPGFHIDRIFGILAFSYWQDISYRQFIKRGMHHSST